MINHKEYLLGSIVEISKLLKKFSFYIPIIETAIIFFDILSSEAIVNMKISDFYSYNSTSNPSTINTFFKGVANFIDGKPINESFADVKVFRIHPIKSLNNIKNTSIIGVINCISAGSSTASSAKNIVNTFAINDRISVDQLLGTACEFTVTKNALQYNVDQV